MGFVRNKGKDADLADPEIEEAAEGNISRQMSETSMYTTEDEVEEDEDNDGNIQLGPQFTLKELQEKDKDDESLRRWKEQLLGSVDVNAVGESLDPEVTILKLEIISAGRSDIVLPIPETGNPEGTWFTLKEGSRYRLKFTFQVNNNIVSGLKYTNTVWKTGMKVDSTKQMIGTFSPQIEPYTHEMQEETTPSGIFARGSYSARTKELNNFYQGDRRDIPTIHGGPPPGQNVRNFEAELAAMIEKIERMAEKNGINLGDDQPTRPKASSLAEMEEELIRKMDKLEREMDLRSTQNEVRGGKDDTRVDGVIEHTTEDQGLEHNVDEVMESDILEGMNIPTPTIASISTPSLIELVIPHTPLKGDVFTVNLDFVMPSFLSLNDKFVVTEKDLGLVGKLFSFPYYDPFEFYIHAELEVRYFINYTTYSLADPSYRGLSDNYFSVYFTVSLNTYDVCRETQRLAL